MAPPPLDRPQPPYLQIVEHYRGLIRDGRLEDGARLPSTRQLAQEWRVAHATAAKVLSTLRNEGLATAVSGGAGGTLVRISDAGRSATGVLETAPYLDPLDRSPLHPVTRRRPGGGRSRVVAADVVDDPPGHVLTELALGARVAVVRRRSVVTRGDVPLSVSTGWFAGPLAEVAPDLLVAKRVTEGTAAYVARCTGRVLAGGRDELRIAPADAATAAALRVAEGSLVIATRSWVWDTAGGVVEFGESASAPSLPLSYEYRYLVDDTDLPTT